MNAFNVTWERVNEREATQGGTARHGMEQSSVSLREAMRAVSQAEPSMSERRGVYANDSQPDRARWVSAESECWEDGDTLTMAIHFPDNTTPSSRARLVRFLSRNM